MGNQLPREELWRGRRPSLVHQLVEPPESQDLTRKVEVFNDEQLSSSLMEEVTTEGLRVSGWFASSSTSEARHLGGTASVTPCTGSVDKLISDNKARKQIMPKQRRPEYPHTPTVMLVGMYCAFRFLCDKDLSPLE